MTTVEAIKHISQEPLSEVLSRDGITSEFSVWFEGALKGASRIRLKDANLAIHELLGGNVDSLIDFLGKFIHKPISCGLVHEMGERVIVLVDKSTLKLNQFSCPMQEYNLACGHPELSKLAHAIFLAEKLLNDYRYKRGILILKEFIELDELVGALPSSGRDRKQQIINHQNNLIPTTTEYVSELIRALNEKYQ